MNTSILGIWYVVGDLSVPKLAAQESAALIILAASLVVFRTFRERYLLVWILGWVAYFLSRWTPGTSAAERLTSDLIAIRQVEFILAVCLFAGAVFVYTHARKFVRPLVVIAVVLMAFAAVRALYWPDVFILRAALEIAYRLVALAASFELIRYRWGRGEIGPWLMAGGLLLVHLDWASLGAIMAPSLGLMADLILGLSMLLIVLDDSRIRSRRLAVVNAVTSTISRSRQQAPMMTTALEELKILFRAKAAWFRLLEGESLVMSQQIGLSAEFLEDRNLIPIDKTIEPVLRDGVAVVVRTAEATECVQPYLEQERFHHVVMVPVVGKKSPIGMLTLGSRRRFSYAPDDMEFLANSAHQLGLGVENLRLVEQILRSHRQWSNTFDSIQDLVLLHDPEFHVMKANRALLQRLKQSHSDIVGQSCEMVLPRDRGEWKACPYCHGGDELFWEGADPCFGGFSMVSTSSYTEQNSHLKGTIHVIRDTSDRRVAEEKYRLLFEQVQEGVFVATTAGKLVDCNDAFMRMLGYGNREELMAVNVDTDLYASREQRDVFRKEVERRNYVRNFEVALRRKDGTLLTAMESSFATRDAAGKVERYQGFLLDMTEKKRAEDEIRRRNRELNALNAMAVIATQSFDLDEILNLTLRQVISLLGAETGSVYLSDADETTFRRRAGWGQRSADRARFSEVKLPDFGDLVTRSRAEVLTPEYLPHLPPVVADFIRADNLSSWIWVLLWSKDKPIGIMGISSREAREYSSNDENLLVAIGRQLATTIEKVRLYEETCRAYEDLRRTQEQLLQSEKMSAVGQLISGVAHELNNPLTAILGYAQLLESEDLEDRASDFVKKLFKQAQRTHRVVQNLLSFARQRKPQKRQVDISRVIDETLALRDYDLKVNDISLEREVESPLPLVVADPHQLEQVFLNIINNAVDAILETGAGGTLGVHVHARDGQVFAEFRDSGPGIKEPSRIFDPFYTTKTVGKGTGLGLSICYGIVKEHGGDISAHNPEEGGAVIEVRLPAAAPAGQGESAVPPQRREFAIAGRILLVEDEEAVLEFERDVLTGAGAQVTALMNAEEVKSRVGNEPFDALIINGKMPGGWGAQEVYRWLAEKAPGMEKQVLFTFSSVPEPETRTFLQENNVPSLAKPFEVADLIAQARRLLPKAQAAGAG
ncbi:MAG TPA: ATP-binding protein [Terriglobales bacterium]|nr:ATP-binding protein [Terriglobales bacterium]